MYEKKDLITVLQELLKANKELSHAVDNSLGKDEVDYAMSILDFAIDDLFSTIGINREAMEKGNY